MTKDLEMDLRGHIEAQSEFQKETQVKLVDLEKELDGWLEEMCAVSVMLRDKSRSSVAAAQATISVETPPPAPAPSVAPPPAMASVTQAAAPLPDYKDSIEKLLQGSIDALGDRLSDRIMAMLKELKTMGGPMREAKMAELRDVAQSERVDLASLFLHEKVESNLGEGGLKIEETKGGSVGSILDKLKKMKGGGDAAKTG